MSQALAPSVAPVGSLLRHGTLVQRVLRATRILVGEGLLRGGGEQLAPERVVGTARGRRGRARRGYLGGGSGEKEAAAARSGYKKALGAAATGPLGEGWALSVLVMRF